MKKTGNKSGGTMLRKKSDSSKTELPSVSTAPYLENENQKLLQNLELYQNELKSQNEELLLAIEKYETVIQKYIELYEFSPAGHYTLSKDGEIMELNLTGANMLSRDRLHLITNNFETFVFNTSKPVFKQFLEQVFAGKGKASCEVIINTNDFGNSGCQLTGIVTSNGNQCLMTMVDITARKQNETDLRLYGEIMENMSEGVFLTHAGNGTIVYTNSRFEIMHGYSPGELIGKHVSVINAPTEKSPEETAQIITSLLNKTGFWHGEIQNIKKDGTKCWGYANVSTFDHPQYGKVWISIHHDITQSKKAQEALKDNNLKLDLAMQAAHMAWWEMDVPTGNVTFEKRKAEMLGFAPEKFSHYTDFTALVHPDDFPLTMSAMQKHLTGDADAYEVEYRIMTSSGKYVWFYDIGSIIKRDSEGHPINVAGIVININDRKIAEEALQKSEENLKSFVSHSPDIIYRFSNKRGGLFWSDKVRDILGFSPEEIIENPFLWNNSIHPDDQILVKKAIEEDSKESNYNINYRIKTKNGSWVWLHDYFMNKVIVDDEIIIEGHATDITERKKLEDSLRILSYAVDQSPVSIVITDTNGIIEYVNPKFTQLTGYSLIEAYEKNPSILKTGYTSKEEYSNLWKTISSGNEWIGEFCNKKKNGELYWESAVISPIIDDKGEITHYVAIKEDITSQKETERRIQASIIEAEERERIYFSQELHDGIGPLLSAAKMYVQWLGMPNAKLGQSEIIKDIEKFLDESSRTIREISFKLSPHILQNFGLVEAIKSYTAKVKEGTEIDFSLILEDIGRFEMNSETIAYRVLCECINNTLKHAEASEISIDIHSKNNVLFVEYSDNGIGFIIDNTLTGRKGIGLFNMQNRLKSINGQVSIISAPGKGTTVKFQFKMNNK